MTSADCENYGQPGHGVSHLLPTLNLLHRGSRKMKGPENYKFPMLFLFPTTMAQRLRPGEDRVLNFLSLGKACRFNSSQPRKLRRNRGRKSKLLWFGARIGVLENAISLSPVTNSFLGHMSSVIFLSLHFLIGGQRRKY